nr:TMEM175 family protein [Ktedonobacteraceae bacterium]
MRLPYHQIAGQSLDRLAALSDGIFAVAMTLLVLNLHVPASGALASEHAVWDLLVHLSPSLLAYGMSFLTLGIFWIGQQTQLDRFARSDRWLTWIHLAFLLAVTLMPFSTGLLAASITSRLALVVYWLNLLLLGIALLGGLTYAKRAGLIKEERVTELRYERYILIAQALYAFAVVLCIISTYVSIALIILVQGVFGVAPRLRWLDRL